MVDVNLIPKEYRKRKEKLSAIFSKTGGIALILFILSLLFYGGLLLYQGKLSENLESIKEEVMLLDQKRDPDTEKAIIDSDKRLEVLKELFEEHFYWSKIFSKIEELVVSEAYFSQSKLSFSEEMVDVSFAGNTLTYTTLARQILSFQEESSVEKVKVSGISLSSDGGIDFNLEVVFSKDILLK